MNKYRLHIDFPLTDSLEESKDRSNAIMQAFLRVLQEQQENSGQDVNFRLGNDGDRQKSNYLEINENGHVNNKKSKTKI